MIDDDLPKSEVKKSRGAVKFDRLRLNGFKSFPDTTEIEIKPGLTGIVGPNGCGKSNLLEGLKWALGETSARRMRGTGMDDVIFGGSDRRPARNVSEVTVTLDNTRRTAPTMLNDSDTLEIVRRIERGQGTSYKVNGRPTRMRDVQILFQDNASGSGSSAIVSQGRVSALINAKASERRSVLEEAAGVAGISARRHDSEIKLKQAETNLQRAEDSLSEVTNQANLLRRQARQLQRYREIDGKIRQARATLLHVRKVRAEAALLSARVAHEENERQVEAAMIAVNAATAAREAAVAAVGPLREQRIAAETSLAKANARLESIENEAARKFKEMQDLEARLIELASDLTREEQAAAEGERAIARLRDERAELAEGRSGEAEALEELSEKVDNAREAVALADASLSEINDALASREASRAAAKRQKEDVERKVDAVEARLKSALQKLEGARSRLPDVAETEAAHEALATLQDEVTVLTEAVSTGEDALLALQERVEVASASLSALEGGLSRAKAELDGLAAVRVATGSVDPVSGRLMIAVGFEAAVAAAFGDALKAGEDRGETQFWAWATDSSPTPVAGKLLANYLKGAAAIEAAAKSVGVFDTEEEVASAGRPAAGTIHVSKDGYFTRWDGLSGRLGNNSVETDLRRQSRMRDLGAEVGELEPRVAALSTTRSGLQANLIATRQSDAAGRARLKVLAENERRQRDAVAALVSGGEEARRVVAVSEAEVTSIRAERQIILGELAEAGQRLADIPDDDGAKQKQALAKAALQAARDAEGNSRVGLERLTNEQRARRQRFDLVLRELVDWEKRIAGAKERRTDLIKRHGEVTDALSNVEEAKATPQDALDEAREIAALEKAAALGAQEALDAAERERDDREMQSREIDARLGSLREQRATLIAGISQAQALSEAVGEMVVERFGAAEIDLASIAGIEVGQALPEPQAAEALLHRLESEKENFGPINQLAESELEEHERRLGDMQKGREEVADAIATLRKAIKELEDEARAKLEDAFDVINRNFGELFVRLFDGGQAYLRLTEPDILEAGLEIYASPPGKRMQILSLFSGGEQTLTAMALIFAAFLSNPSPICVLDEADAALDDSNTDRLIRMVESMATNDFTRFLVITHNPLTMSRMDRLYGVTQIEKGCSVASLVDLNRAFDLTQQ